MSSHNKDDNNEDMNNEDDNVETYFDHINDIVGKKQSSRQGEKSAMKVHSNFFLIHHFNNDPKTKTEFNDIDEFQHKYITNNMMGQFATYLGKDARVKCRKTPI